MYILKGTSNFDHHHLVEHDAKWVGPDRADQAAFYVGVFHATDLNNRRSVGGYMGDYWCFCSDKTRKMATKCRHDLH